MEWTGMHGRLLAKAFEEVLGHPETGAIAFTRCLDPNVVIQLAEEDQFAPRGWDTRRVADHVGNRTVTADAAVESREDKGTAKLLLVDTERAGAGMDGIYSASREVDEASLFDIASRLAGAELTRQTSRKNRDYAERAVRVARRAGSRHGVSPWPSSTSLSNWRSAKTIQGHTCTAWALAHSGVGGVGHDRGFDDITQVS